MNTKSTDLFLSREVQNILDSFAVLLDIRVTLYSIAGERMCRGKAMRNCDFCQLVQNDLHRLDACLSLDQFKQSESASMQHVAVYHCHAGLCEAVAPINVHGKLVGFLMIGQFRTDDQIEPDWEQEYPDAEIRQKLRDAYHALPSFSREKLDGILDLYKTLVDYIAVRELAVVQDDYLRQEIDRYIDKNGSGNIRLPEMARKLGRSVSTISQFLRRNYHTSFKELVIEHRLALAERFWKQHPPASVAEAAFAAGFSDQFYFARVFRRRRGLPPGAFRESLRNPR